MGEWRSTYLRLPGTIEVLIVLDTNQSFSRFTAIYSSNCGTLHQDAQQASEHWVNNLILVCRRARNLSKIQSAISRSREVFLACVFLACFSFSLRTNPLLPHLVVAWDPLGGFGFGPIPRLYRLHTSYKYIISIIREG